jgi:hypothetical protein
MLRSHGQEDHGPRGFFGHLQHGADTAARSRPAHDVKAGAFHLARHRGVRHARHRDDAVPY